MERRKRISRPIPIFVFGIFFLTIPFINYFGYIYQFKIPIKSILAVPISEYGLIFFILPIVNYFNFAFQIQVPIHDVSTVVKIIDVFALILSVVPFVFAIGILLVKRWGWFMFLGYSLLVLFFNTVVLFYDPTDLNIFTLVQCIIGFTAIFYFLKPDISTPYMKMYGRGWRYQKRKPVEVELMIDMHKLKTKDISATGFYVEWSECPLSLNQEVDILFSIENQKLSVKAGVVRLDSEGAGFAFRYLDNQSKLTLKKLIS